MANFYDTKKVDSLLDGKLSVTGGKLLNPSGTTTLDIGDSTHPAVVTIGGTDVMGSVSSRVSMSSDGDGRWTFSPVLIDPEKNELDYGMED